MEEKDFLDKLQKSKVRQIIFFMLVMGIALIIYMIVIQKIQNDKFYIKGENESYIFQLENMQQTNKKIVIEGFCFLLGQDSSQNEYEIILYNKETEENFLMKLEQIKRKEVKEYFWDGYDYSYSGFSASISSKKLDLEKHCYEIMIRKKGTNGAYKTDIYLANGKVQYHNYFGNINLEVKGTELEDVINNGILHVCRPDIGIYVYQYNMDLYWITDNNYKFDNNDFYVRFLLYTNQVDKLPEERIQNNLDSENCNFMFRAAEIEMWNVRKYRVSKKKLDTSYSITKIVTGEFGEQWIWREEFIPCYYFR